MNQDSQKMKVLLLEDDFMLGLSIRTFLEHQGYEVEYFENGKKALSVVKKQRFDFYILDVNTPGVRGVEVLKVIRRRTLSKPVIMISANHDSDYIARTYGLGCSDYVKKPFTLSELHEKMLKILDASKEVDTSHIVILSPNYSYDLQSDLLKHNGVAVKMPKTQNMFLRLLVLNIGKVVTQEDVGLHIWKDPLSPESTIRSLVNRTRSLITDPIIQTHKGLGYELVVLS